MTLFLLHSLSFIGEDLPFPFLVSRTSAKNNVEKYFTHSQHITPASSLVYQEEREISPLPFRISFLLISRGFFLSCTPRLLNRCNSLDFSRVKLLLRFDNNDDENDNHHELGETDPLENIIIIQKNKTKIISNTASATTTTCHFARTFSVGGFLGGDDDGDLHHHNNNKKTAISSSSSKQLLPERSFFLSTILPSRFDRLVSLNFTNTNITDGDLRLMFPLPQQRESSSSSTATATAKFPFLETLILDDCEHVRVDDVKTSVFRQIAQVATRLKVLRFRNGMGADASYVLRSLFPLPTATTKTKTKTTTKNSSFADDDQKQQEYKGEEEEEEEEEKGATSLKSLDLSFPGHLLPSKTQKKMLNLLFIYISGKKRDLIELSLQQAFDHVDVFQFVKFHQDPSKKNSKNEDDDLFLRCDEDDLNLVNKEEREQATTAITSSPPLLRKLDLSFSGFVDLSLLPRKFPNLRILILENCSKLQDETVGCHFTKAIVENLIFLEVLNLSGCYQAIGMNSLKVLCGCALSADDGNGNEKESSLNPHHQLEFLRVLRINACVSIQNCECLLALAASTSNTQFSTQEDDDGIASSSSSPSTTIVFKTTRTTPLICQLTRLDIGFLMNPMSDIVFKQLFLADDVRQHLQLEELILDTTCSRISSHQFGELVAGTSLKHTLKKIGCKGARFLQGRDAKEYGKLDQLKSVNFLSCSKLKAEDVVAFEEKKARGEILELALPVFR